MRVACFILMGILLLPAPAVQGEALIGLCYHRIADGGEGGALSTDSFLAQLTWMRENSYHPVGIDDLLAAADGRRPLPERAVLLTFDDGESDFYTRVYPLLRLFNYPAVLALVGRWMTEPEMVSYGDRPRPRQEFLTWEQVREMIGSGLVEVASHTYDLHRGVPANPQGNSQPAVVTRIYDSASGSYEDDQLYLRRLRDDFTASADLIERETGRRPRVIAWPYGAYNQPALAVARETGMEIGLALWREGAAAGSLAEMQRLLIGADMTLPAFVQRLQNQNVGGPHRVVQVDLDSIHDPDPERTETNLSLLLDRIKQMGIDTVYLQAFADPDGNGTAEALYFPNRHLPMRADLFNRVAWQLRTRTGVRVYAWMPVLGFDVGNESLLVQCRQADGSVRPDPLAYRRLSPFAAEARQLIGEIYEDLARHADFDGLLFHDDAFLADREDAGPQALARYMEIGLPGRVEEIQADPALRERWTAFKTRTLVQLTEELAEKVRFFRPAVQTARNIYARTLLEPASEAWFAQSYPVFLAHYDQVAVMAMPWLEEVDDPDRWLTRLVSQAAGTPQGMAKTVFELQSVDWRQKPARRLPTATLVQQLELLQSLGGRHFGYYPDDFLRDHPEAALLRASFSLEQYPFRPAP